MKGPDNLVLLFYDGFERQAESSPLGYLKAEARRHVRFVWRTASRKQVRTGYYTAFLNLCLALKTAGVDYRINDFATARRYPDHPIGVCGYPTVFGKLESLPNPRLVGPGLYSSPSENPTLMNDARNRFYIERCEWMKELFTPYYGADRLRPWFRGFDVSRFEDVSVVPKSYDVLIYDKIYHNRDDFYPRTIEPFIKQLEAEGRTYKVYHYGHYINHDYMADLRLSKTLAFFAHSETQGHAYQEAMAMNIPVFAWDEGVWLDPLAKQVSDKPIWASSVPHFDERCGLRFKADSMLDVWAKFWPKVSTFKPREFIGEMSLQRSAALYLQALRDTANSAPARPVVAKAAAE